MANTYLYCTLGVHGNKRRSTVREYAHRLVCYAFKGEPKTEELEVLHTCNNKACLNPKHLTWESHKDNMAEWKLAKEAKAQAHKRARKA